MLDTQKKMSVVVNSISLGVNPAYSGFRDLVEITGGKNIEFTPESDHNGLPIDYSSEDLASAFSAIFSGIVQSSSSTLAVNDKVYADVLPKKVQMRASGLLYLDGKLTDLSSVGAIRYTTSYGFEQRYGVISAVIPYIIEEKVDEHGEKFAEIGLYELWNTNQTIKSGQGRYITYLNENQAKDNNPTGTRLYRVHSSKVRSTFSDIYKANNLSNHDNEISHTHIHWLYEFTKPEFSPYNLRARMTPMGSIINSDIRLANKDILNVNISKKTMSQQLNKEMIKWLQYKAQWQPRNYIIASDNDGFINFINAQRGLRKEERYKGGQLDTAYFPQISYHRIDEIAVKDKKPVRVFDGHTNLTDAKVYQKGRGNYYATLGMTGMGAGGKGLVGYRIFASDMNTVNNWVDNKLNPRPVSYTDPIDKVIPMFEITNEGKPEFRTRGFENLGYTYSGFEYFNRYITKNNEQRGQAVAVFGNGFGTEKSTIYFIDAYTGEKLNEIILSHDGGGAASPAIVVAADAIEGQKISSLYVGDYSGTLYKVEFNNKDFTDNSSIRVTALFKAPVTKIGQSAISTRPLVVTNIAGQKQIFFGTGIAADKKLDRGDNSKVLHNIYGITDRNLRSELSSSTAEYMRRDQTLRLAPLLSVNNLKAGDVKYNQGTQIDYLQDNRYDVDIITPVEPNPNNTNNARLDGWYVRLSADGINSGERVIQDPKYDGVNRSIIFSTWGVIETQDVDDEGLNANGLYDPCFRDNVFGKILAFNLVTGAGAIGGGNGGLSNIGSVGTIPGGITGDLINQGPEDNSTTSLEDLGADLVDELIEIVGKGDSSLSIEGQFSAVCEGTIDDEGRCVSAPIGSSKPPMKLERQRVDIRKIL